MANEIEKHRSEVRNYAVDFADELASGESLSGTPEVAVFSWADETDVTSQFSPTNKVISGTEAQFRLAKASGSDQDEKKYKVRVTVTTDQNQELVSVHELWVDETTAGV